MSNGKDMAHKFFNFKDVGGFVFFVAIVVFIVLVVKGASRMMKQNKSVRNNCIPTEMFVIGNKGHKTRVYDCSNLGGEND